MSPRRSPAWTLPGSRHTLGTVSIGSGTAHPEQGQESAVMVPDPVVARIRELLPEAQRSVANAIVSIPAGDAEPVPLTVPGDPPGTDYWALRPGSPDAPVVIYREALPGEGGRYLVTALMDRQAYLRYRPVASDQLVQGVAAAVSAGTISAVGTPLPPHVSTVQSPAAVAATAAGSEEQSSSGDAD